MLHIVSLFLMALMPYGDTVFMAMKNGKIIRVASYEVKGKVVQYSQKKTLYNIPVKMVDLEKTQKINDDPATFFGWKKKKKVSDEEKMHRFVDATARDPLEETKTDIGSILVPKEIPLDELLPTIKGRWQSYQIDGKTTLYERDSLVIDGKAKVKLLRSGKAYEGEIVSGSDKKMIMVLHRNERSLEYWLSYTKKGVLKLRLAAKPGFTWFKKEAE